MEEQRSVTNGVIDLGNNPEEDIVLDAVIEAVVPTHPQALFGTEIEMDSSASSPVLESVKQGPRLMISSKSRGLRMIVLLVLGVISVMIFVVVGAIKGKETYDNINNDWDYETKLEEIKSRLGTTPYQDPITWLDPRSPQSLALEWLTYQDKALTIADDDSRIFQRYALIVFAYATNAELWRGMDPWYHESMAGSHECSFVGIDCNLDKEIVSIDLVMRKLSGTLPEELGLLTELKSLLVGQNLLEGSIPDSISQKLTKLEHIDLSTNFISSTISDNIGSLKDLKTFLAARTSLFGTLPETMMALTNLEAVNVQGTRLEGNIFEYMTQWRNLREIDISYSLFTGKMPIGEINTLTNLQALVAMQVQLNITLPTEIGLLTNLEFLAIESGRSYGRGTTIPSEIGKLVNLNVLTLAGRSFKGSIPSEIGYLTDLSTLAFNGGRLTGNIPSEIGKLERLEILYLEGNRLEGTIPFELGNLGDTLIEATFNHNYLNGKLPMRFCFSDADILRDCTVQCDCCQAQYCL